MKYYQELYADEGAWAVINDTGTYKGWSPSDSTAAKAIANTDGTGIESETEAEKIGTGERLPVVVDKNTSTKLKNEYESLTSS